MRRPEFRIDSLFTFSLYSLVFAGLLNLFSASKDLDVFLRQLAATGFGAVLFAALSRMDYRTLRKFSTVLYVLGVAVLFLTWKFGREVRATRSWIDLGFFSVQPSELFKALFVLQLAAHLGRIQQARPNDRRSGAAHRATLLSGLVWPAVLLLIPVGMILLQKDVGTAGVYVPVFFILLFMADLHFTLMGVCLWVGLLAGLRGCFRIFWELPNAPDIPLLRYLAWPVSGTVFVIGLAAALILLAIRLRASHFRGGGTFKIVLVVWIILFAGIWSGDRFYKSLKPHQKSRIASFFMPEIDRQGSAYQAQQAQIAVGSGGIFGKGYLKGTQKGLGFLPEQSTDFAFSVLAEEWGFFGSVMLLLLYGCLIGSAVEIAREATELYGCLLSIGAASVFFVHVTIGTAMNLGLFPIIGIPMPFLSYGGSAQVLNLALAGLILSVARHRRLLAA